MNRRWVVKEARVAHETPYFRVVHSRVSRPDGSDVDYHTVDFPRPAVAIALRDEAGRVLLIRQQRFIVDRDVWALPSGGVEAGEALEEAAVRELEEETGMRAGAVSHLVSFYPSYGVSNQVFHCFVAGRAEEQGQDLDMNEVSAIAWFSLPDIESMIARGDIPDGFSLVPLLHLLRQCPPQPRSEADRCRVVGLCDDTR
jgi:8-oxo-dGTP pyrophosphatase MutT (NUDIX family)